MDKGAKIIVISKDENIYSRCMLHHLISGHRTIEGINFVDGDFMEKQNATWIKKATVKEIYPDNKKIKYENIFLPPNSKVIYTTKLYNNYKLRDNDLLYE